MVHCICGVKIYSVYGLQNNLCVGLNWYLELHIVGSVSHNGEFVGVNGIFQQCQ